MTADPVSGGPAPHDDLYGVVMDAMSEAINQTGDHQMQAIIVEMSKKILARVGASPPGGPAPREPDALPLSANPTALEVRARFDELMAALPEYYDHGGWDAQVVAWLLCQEVRRANACGPLCEDEGCQHHGTAHHCDDPDLTPEDVATLKAVLSRRAVASPSRGTNTPTFPDYRGYYGPRSCQRPAYAADVCMALAAWVEEADPKSARELREVAKDLHARADENLEDECPK